MDQIGNLLTTLRNAELAGHSSTQVLNSQMNKAILGILEKNGYITSSKEEEGKIAVVLSKPEAIHHYKRISKPGRRVYVDAKHIPSVLGGRGMVILSSPEGVISGKDAKKQHIGGELLCEVY